MHAAAFKWDNFDPVAFLIQFNEGYPMTIPDMANSFYVIPPKKDQSSTDNGDNQIATISCTGRPPCTRWTCDMDYLKHCKNPKFAIKKNMINVPVLNQTADKLYDRIIPKPGGDCKLVADVAARRYGASNITQTGAPVAIACNISASLDVNGSAVAVQSLDGGNPQVATLHSSGNASTDHAIHNDAAPPPAGFANVLNATNAICFDNKVCLPNGTYDGQAGGLASGVDFGGISSMTLPVGASMRFIVELPPPAQRIVEPQHISYTRNQTTANADFSRAMKVLSKQTMGQGGHHNPFDALVPGPDPPVLCLFTEQQYHGGVVCYGPGSGNMTDDVVNTAQSLIPHGNVIARAYGVAYSDTASLLITDSIADLSTRPLGDTDTFSKAIKALWIVDPSAPVGANAASISLPILPTDLATNESSQALGVPASNATIPTGNLTCPSLASFSSTDLLSIYCAYLNNGQGPPADFSLGMANNLTNGTDAGAGSPSVATDNSAVNVSAVNNSSSMLVMDAGGNDTDLVQPLPCPPDNKTLASSLVVSTTNATLLSDGDVLIVYCAYLHNLTLPFNPATAFLSPYWDSDGDSDQVPIDNSTASDLGTRAFGHSHQQFHQQSLERRRLHGHVYGLRN